MKKFPKFFVVGAAKSGTTTIYHWLKAHVSVFVPEEKEPRFFCGIKPTFRGPGSDLFNRSLVSKEEDYLSLYDGASDRQVCGDFSVDYLNYEAAADNIKEKVPNAKIIMVLRNPVKRAFSEHTHLVRDICEEKTFKESLLLEEERLDSGWQPLFAHKKRGFYYHEVKKYFELFGRENVKVFLYEDLSNDPVGMMKEICAFLDIEVIDFDYELKTNVSGNPRLMFIQKVIHSDAVKRLLLPLIGRGIGTRIKWWLISKNIKKGIVIDGESESFLREYFASDIKSLSKLINRDLSAWLKK